MSAIVPSIDCFQECDFAAPVPVFSGPYVSPSELVERIEP